MKHSIFSVVVLASWLEFAALADCLSAALTDRASVETSLLDAAKLLSQTLSLNAKVRSENVRLKANSKDRSMGKQPRCAENHEAYEDGDKFVLQFVTELLSDVEEEDAPIAKSVQQVMEGLRSHEEAERQPWRPSNMAPQPNGSATTWQPDVH